MCCTEEAITVGTCSFLRGPSTSGDWPVLPLWSEPGIHPQGLLGAGGVWHLYWKPPMAPHSERWHLPWLPLALHRLAAHQAGTTSCQVEQMFKSAWGQNLGKNLVQRLRLWTKKRDWCSPWCSALSIYLCFLIRIILVLNSRTFFFFDTTSALNLCCSTLAERWGINIRPVNCWEVFFFPFLKINLT